MRILIAPDSFKESLSSKDVSTCIERGIKMAAPSATTLSIPLSDGGEGALEILQTFSEGKLITLETVDPLNRPISASYFVFADQQTAWVELASASGLALLKKKERNPLLTSTFGTGILLKDAFNRGCNRIILGLGGSATNDAGVGIIKALGGRFLDKQGKELNPTGKHIGKIARFESSELIQKIKGIELIIAGDVTNPLIGKSGCAQTYAPQKGAKANQVERLEKNMIHFAAFLEKQTGNDWTGITGGGAAGGTAAGLSALLDAQISNGFEVLTKIIGLENQLDHLDLIITGEGKYDQQSNYGKVVFRVAQLAAKKNIPVVVLTGIAEQVENPLVTAVFSIVNRPMSRKKAIAETGQLLTNTAYQVIKLFMI
jgi:glycerate 2-kinase